jgi:hypothetical protein
VLVCFYGEKYREIPTCVVSLHRPKLTLN